MDKVEKRRNFLIDIFFWAVIFALVYLFMNYAFWITFPFILAFLIAAALQRPINYITSHTPLKRGFLTIVFQLLVIAAILGPIALLVIKLISEFSGFFDYLKIKLDDMPSFFTEIRELVVSFVPGSLKHTVDSYLETILGNLQQNLSGATSTLGESITQSGATSGFDFSTFSSPLQGIWNTAKQLPTYLLSILVAFIAGCFITIDYKQFKEFIARQLSPEKRETVFRAKKAVKLCLSKMVKAYLMLITITFCEMFIAFNLFKLIGIYEGSYIFALAIVIAIVDILPVLGTGTILIPWALYSFIISDFKMGLALVILYAVVTVLRQILEPKLVSGQLGLPAFVTIIAMFFGAKLFGFIGLFLLPITIIVLKILNDEGTIHLWTPSKQDEDIIKETNEEAEKGTAAKKRGKHFFKK